VQHAGSRLTKSGILIGTPHYIAPEQVSGGSAGTLSDIYSLGAVMYEMFAGTPPFTGDTAVNIIFKHLNAPVPRISEAVPEIDEALDSLVHRMMAKNPGDRPPNVDEVLEVITSILDGLNRREAS